MLFVFAVSAFVQISFWIAIWVGIRRCAPIRPSDHAGTTIPVSVIVAVRDEAETVGELLNALAKQHHPTFEVILVDDGSSDRTAELISEMCSRDPRFRLVKNPNDRQGKKGAVSTGISHATHDLVALTDADCRPGPGWVSAVARAHDDHNLIVAGYGPYSRQQSWLNALIRFETLSTAMMTAGTIGLGFAYMAVGRNLSYSKNVAARVRDSSRGQDLLSGDDDLFVQKASESGIGFRYMLDPDSFVVSAAPGSLRAWLRQKRRHLSASRSYRISAVTVLLSFHLSSGMCWAAPWLLGWPGLLVLGAKFSAQWPAIAAASSRFREKGLVAATPILDLGWLVSLLALTPLGVLFPPKKW